MFDGSSTITLSKWPVTGEIVMENQYVDENNQSNQTNCNQSQTESNQIKSNHMTCHTFEIKSYLY